MMQSKLSKCGEVLTIAVLLLGGVLTPFAQAQQGSDPAAEKRVDSLLATMTLDEKISMLGGVDGFYIRPIPRLGLRALRMSDGPVGVHAYGLTTAYTAGIALAASWDTDLARRIGENMGREARARGVHFILGPGMNIYRAPMAGRNFEYLGEDPYLASRIVVPLVAGIQSQGVIATLKHFAANNQEYDRQRISSDIDERTLREIYLPAFEAAVKEARAGAIMDSYNLLNGEHLTQNAHLNTEIVKKEWGFDGIIMSDWAATHDGVAAANGGLDLEMPNAVYMTPQNLKLAIERGQVSLATIDDKVRRILRKAIQFGFYDREQMDGSIPLYNQEGRALALEEARGSMVLLKNVNHVLPLDKTKIRTIAVIGPNAYPAVPGGGGSSQVQPFASVSFLEGISNYLGTGVRVLKAADDIPLDDVVTNTELTISPGGERGVKAEFFDNPALQGTPALVRTDPRIAFYWGEGSYRDNGPDEHFSVRWSGYYKPAEDGEYVFNLAANDGGRLFVDDHLVLDIVNSKVQQLDSYLAPLKAARQYKIVVEYVKNQRTGMGRFGITPVQRPAQVNSGGQPQGTSALEAARKADVVILCVGYDPSLEGEAFDRSFRLPGNQDALISKIAGVNKNVIVVLTAGGNVDMTRWIDKVPGLIHAWYPGQEGGTALAQLLFGEYSPSGKLPVSFERRWEDNATFDSYYPNPGEKRVVYKEGVFLGYRHFDRSAAKPLFPFGFGLSYTNFSYSNLVITPASGDLATPVNVSFDLKNTGSTPGAEVAELYVADAHASIPRPEKELKGFAKIGLKPGETKHVSLALDRRAFSFFDVKTNSWKAEPGNFKILVGGRSAAPELTGTFSLTK
jgi:beta-glucosidase